MGNKIIKYVYTKEMKLGDGGEARANHGYGTNICEECNRDRKIGNLTINNGSDELGICGECFNRQYRVGMVCYDR